MLTLANKNTSYVMGKLRQKVKFTLEKTMKDRMGNRGTALLLP